MGQATMPYRFLCNDTWIEYVKPRPDVASRFFFYAPLHNICYGIQHRHYVNIPASIPISTSFTILIQASTGFHDVDRFSILVLTIKKSEAGTGVCPRARQVMQRGTMALTWASKRNSGRPPTNYAATWTPPNTSMSSWASGQSHLISGAGSTSHVITSQFSKLCCIDALYKALENLDAIALILSQIHLLFMLSSIMMASLSIQGR